MIKRLRLRFILINMLIVAVMLTIILGTVMFFSRQNIEERSYEIMREMSGGPGGRPRPDNSSVDRRIPVFMIEIGENGEISTDGGEFYDLSDESFLKTLVDLVEEDGNPGGELQEYNLRYLKMYFPGSSVLPEPPEERDANTANRIVFTDTSNEHNMISSLRKTCVLIWFTGFAVFFIIVVLLARSVVRPVEEAWEQQKRFVADASHELKTPLTIIMTDAELLASPDCSEKHRGTLVSNISSMAEQMRGLVEGLLDLTRIDGGGEEKNYSRLDFSSAVEAAVIDFEALFFESGLSVKSEVESGIFVSGNEQQMIRLVSILLDNARKYCAPGTETSVSLKRKGNACLLCVSDYGDEIQEEDLKQLFKRFYRADKARAMNHSYGLGLSIAESIVSAHRGEIWCESKDGVNSFLVRLPCIQ